MKILGISAFYHDSAAALVINGKIEAAAQEERFTRKKHDLNFPTNAINFCLNYKKINLKDVDYVIFYEKPFLKFERILETYLSFIPKGFRSFKTSMPLWLKEKIFQKELIKNYLFKIDNSFNKNNILFTEHHLSHAASCFFPSPFKNSAIITMDGVGEWTTTSIAIGKGNKIEIIKEIHFPHSLGLLYSAFTYFLGFKVNSGEYKVMGLAPYGRPKYEKIILDNLIILNNDGSFWLNQDFFDYSVGFTMTGPKFEKLFKIKKRNGSGELKQIHMDIAASIQKVTENVMLKISKYVADKTKMDNLCLAGGVALNCVANSKIIEKKIFKNIWVQPASGDAGGSIGAALCCYHIYKNNKRIVKKNDSMQGSFLGPKYTNSEINYLLKKNKVKFKHLSNKEIINQTVKYIIKGKTIGWFQDRMEFGPRALGNRSIIADPRSKTMQKMLNLKIKFRESFRPFAPSVLESEYKKWFDIPMKKSPYMLFTANLKKERKLKLSIKNKNLKGLKLLYVNRSTVPAITHVDYSARIQTINKRMNNKFYKLLKKFYDKTNCPIIINTSFNVRGEPIVCSPENALACFMSTNLDVLVMENFLILKDEQNKKLENIYAREIGPD